MGKIKAVFFDIDGTLVSFKTHRIPQSTLDAVAALRSRGIKVYIATGRPVPFIDNLGELEYDGMITVTGAHCFTRGGEIIFHRAVSTGSVERVVEHLTHGGPFVGHQNPDSSSGFVCPRKRCLTTHFFLQSRP